MDDTAGDRPSLASRISSKGPVPNSQSMCLHVFKAKRISTFDFPKRNRPCSPPYTKKERQSKASKANVCSARTNLAAQTPPSEFCASQTCALSQQICWLLVDSNDQVGVLLFFKKPDRPTLHSPSTPATKLRLLRDRQRQLRKQQLARGP
jgi:hypothetical protein